MLPCKENKRKRWEGSFGRRLECKKGKSSLRSAWEKCFSGEASGLWVGGGACWPWGRSLTAEKTRHPGVLGNCLASPGAQPIHITGSPLYPCPSKMDRDAVYSLVFISMWSKIFWKFTKKKKKERKKRKWELSEFPSSGWSGRTGLVARWRSRWRTVVITCRGSGGYKENK